MALPRPEGYLDLVCAITITGARLREQHSGKQIAFIFVSSFCFPVVSEHSDEGKPKPLVSIPRLAPGMVALVSHCVYPSFIGRGGHMSPCGSAGWWPRDLQTPLCIQALPIMEGLVPLKVILGIPQAHHHHHPQSGNFMSGSQKKKKRGNSSFLNNYLWSSTPN